MLSDKLVINFAEVRVRLERQRSAYREKLQTDLWELVRVLYPPPKYKWYEHIHKPICDKFFIRKNPSLRPQEWDIRKKRLWLDPRNTHKALALDTLIPTPLGLRELSNIHIGDEVFGSDGNPYKVKGESDIFIDRPAFRVDFSHGHSVVCDADHLWVTSKYGAEPQVRKTSDIANDLFGGARKDRKHFVSPAKPLNFVEGGHVKRKFDAQMPFIKRKNWVIKDITSVMSVPMKCLMVDSPDQTFLVTAACIPTHNTTLGMADMVQWILAYPDVRILIGSGTRDNAIAIACSVKSHFQYNETIRYYFPELCPQANKAADFGSKDEFTCPGRVDKTIKEPTVSVASPDSTVASRHFELCHFDDLVNETNSRTKDGIIQGKSVV